MERFDPVRLALYRHRFEGIAEEMGVTLRRTAHSPNIKERLDFSCAVFDGAGAMVAQAAHIPVHLGAMPASVRAAMQAVGSWREGDVVILNDPFAGGTHLPDITLVSPVFVCGHPSPDYFVASRAHHADVGGMAPGSLPLSTELFQEGLILPPVRLFEAGRRNDALWQVILRNVRTPNERAGDLDAQLAAHATGARRLAALSTRFSPDECLEYARHIQDYSERLLRGVVASWPDGRYEHADVLHRPDGSTLDLVVAVTVDTDRVGFDFTGTADQTLSSLNAVAAITLAACTYVVRCLASEDVPMNAGCFRPIEVTAPEGSVVNASPPAAVAGGNVETSQRVVDVVLGALSACVPDRVPASSQGTMNNLTIGGRTDEGRPFAYYETIAGGMGAGPLGRGLDAVHTHMTNTLNTPVEALERAYPFRIVQYRVRSDSGGAGRYAGGDGVVREYEMLGPCTVTMLSERRSEGPPGLSGGRSGRSGENILVSADGADVVLPAQFSRAFAAGERLRVETPGGGGWGEPETGR